MKKFILRTVALLAVMLVAISCSQNPTNPINSNGVQNSTYIVVFNELGNTIQSNDIDANIKELFSKYNIGLNNLKFTYHNVFNGFAAVLTEEQANILEYDKSIKYVEKDQVVALDDKLEGVIMKGRPPTQTPPKENWGLPYIGGATNNVTGVAWIVDTGIDTSRPDELNVNTSMDKDFINSDNDANDDNGHGSHCAGVIGDNNTTYPIGICPGVELIGVKVLNSQGSGSYSVIIAGIDYVAGNLISGKMNVVNMSFGGGVYDPLDDAVKGLADKGAYICIAAGNSKKNANNYSPSRVEYDKVFTISAHDAAGKFASFSNYGNPPIDYAAPGVTIFSCYKDGGWAWMSGTSMSAPHCCGILLARADGTIGFDGYVTGDKDNNPDKKAHK
jgi:subtilisin family serine protease